MQQNHFESFEESRRSISGTFLAFQRSGNSDYYQIDKRQRNNSECKNPGYAVYRIDEKGNRWLCLGGNFPETVSDFETAKEKFFQWAKWNGLEVSGPVTC